MDNKIATMVCGVVVAILLITTLAIPVIAENGNYTRQEKFTLNNEGIPLVEGDVTAEYIMKWDNNVPQFLSVNGATTTVYFVAGNDATVSPSSKVVTVDLSYGELPVPTRTGYTFDGWYTSTSYTTEITEDSIVTGTADKILYAKWVGNTYTITFDADGGTVSPATKDVVFGSAYGELPVPTYTGHIFGGWFNEDNEVITASNIVNVADDQTLTAVWSLDQYTVSFTTDNHGTVDVQSLTAYYGTAYTISGNTITIGSTTITATADSGWVFDHWTPSTSGTIEGSMTFMANFNQPPVTLTFNTDGVGSVDVPSIADVPRGTQYVVSDNTVTIVGISTVTASLPNGYYMIGWNVPQGTGTVTDTMTFTASYEVIEISKVVCSTYTTWAVTTDGKLFGCGMNTYGQQGDGTTTNVTTFTQRLDTETIADVVCSGFTTWTVTTDGKLFGCGKNDYGQQGDGTTTNVSTFTQRLNTETIADVIVSFGDVTWVLTTDGKLYGCGKNVSGQQGDGTTTNVSTFTQRLTTKTIISIGVSDDTTWAVTTDGKLFGCGEGSNKQQSSGSNGDVKTFTQRLNTETISSVSCSWYTTWTVTTDGKLFGCGYNANGQQGDGTTTIVSTFTQRGAEGTVNIQPAQVTPVLNPPIHLNPNLPFNPSIILGVVTASDIIGTDYTWLAGGLDWMLCTVTIGEGQYGIALYYAGLTEPLIWDDDVTFEFSNGTMSVVNNGTTYTMDYTSIYYRGNGQYVLTQGSAYVLESTSLIGYAIPTVDSAIEVYYISGTADAITIADGSIVLGEGYVVSQETDYEEISEITEIGATFDTDSTAICDSLIAPKKVTITHTVEDNTLKDLMNIVPILLVISVFMFVAGFIVYRRF